MEQCPQSLPLPRTRVFLSSGRAAEGWHWTCFHRRTGTALPRGPGAPLCRRVRVFWPVSGLWNHSGRQRSAGLGGDATAAAEPPAAQPLRPLLQGTPRPCGPHGHCARSWPLSPGPRRKPALFHSCLWRKSRLSPGRRAAHLQHPRKARRAGSRPGPRPQLPGPPDHREQGLLSRVAAGRMCRRHRLEPWLWQSPGAAWGGAPGPHTWPCLHGLSCTMVAPSSHARHTRVGHSSAAPSGRLHWRSPQSGCHSPSRTPALGLRCPHTEQAGSSGLGPETEAAAEVTTDIQQATPSGLIVLLLSQETGDTVVK